MIPVAAATPTVAPWRERLDLTAVHGVPAHITVLYPFVDPTEIDGGHLRALVTVFAATPAFDFVLDRVGFFDESVVYLAPTPAAPFVELTRRVVDRFPDQAPYGGAHQEITPHLTVGDRGDPSTLRAAAAAVEPALPIAARATEVWLLIGTRSPPTTARAPAWQVRARFVLGAAPAHP